MTINVFSLLTFWRQKLANQYRGFSRERLDPLVLRFAAGRRLLPLAFVDLAPTVLSADQANEFISRGIRERVPTFVGRYSSGELRAVVGYHRSRTWSLVRKLAWRLLRLESAGSAVESLRLLSGPTSYFDPGQRDELERFVQETTRSVHNVDLLASWVKGENHLPAAPVAGRYCELDGLEPFFSDKPWTAELAGLRVLVVHPFKKSIETQYARRMMLFTNHNVLPEFTLETLKPPWRALDSHPGLPAASWSSLLAELTDKVNGMKFDVAIVGAGAFGMPLASAIRSSGRTAVVMGAATQLLFGIWGARWEQFPRHRALRNEYWIRPDSSEVPSSYLGIENGAYW